MNRAALHEGLRRMRFESLLDRHQGGELTQAEAAEMLGVSERTFRRWTERFEEEGEAGLCDRRFGRPSPKRAPAEEIARMLGLFKEKYSDFTVKHFHEQLRKRHNYKLGYTVTKVHLHRAGLVRPAPKRPAHRKKRPRRPFVGMMLHQDGSRHAFSGALPHDALLERKWLGGRAPLDLIVTLDDATGAIYSAFLVEEEGTASPFWGLREVIERHGLFCSLYTDRGSHYFFTPQAGGKVSKTQLTQVGRALAHLGIEHIAAYSPEARGRPERAFRTLQDRLPEELRLAGIATVEAANAWLSETYIAEYNRLFAIEPLEEGSAFVADTAGVWRETLCVIEERAVANDNTVAWAGRRLQIPPSRLRPHFVKASVRVHEYPDGMVSIFLGPHRLATFDAGGTEIVSAPAAISLASCSKPSRPSPAGRAKGAALTASARGAFADTRARTEKRASSRTKKRALGEVHTAA
jgi:transposase